MNGNEAIRLAVPRLAAAGIDGAVQDARALLAFALDVAQDRLTLCLNDPLTESALARFDTAVRARLARQPVSQIIGHRLFWGRKFIVTPATLDPRPETEILVAEALCRPFSRILDLGCGTGCIVLSCLADMPMAEGLATDVSIEALAVAARNAKALELAARVRFLRSDWFSDVSGTFDLIVSNPPYIAASEIAALAPEVRNWEPHLALTPGPDGLASYREIATGAYARLSAGGRILLEVGPTQAKQVASLLSARGFEALRVLRDLDGRDRIVVAEKPGQ